MELKVINKTEQPLLSRTELAADVSYEAVTPSRADIKKSLASQLNTTENLIVLKKVDASFGGKKAKILANVYKKEEDMKRIETKPALTKGLPKEKKAEEEPKPEAK